MTDSKFNRSITVIYDCCAGGEFFSWMLAQQNGFNPLQFLIQPGNKWNLEPTGDLTPAFFHMDREDIANVNFHPTKINVMRDHGVVLCSEYHDENDHNEFVEKYYDQWTSAGFIVLAPTTQKSVNYINMLMSKKFGETNNALTLLQHMTWTSLVIDALGDCDYIVVDPYEIYVSNTDDQIQQLEEFMYTIFDPGTFVLDTDTMKFLIKVWREHNDNPFIEEL